MSKAYDKEYDLVHQGMEKLYGKPQLCEHCHSQLVGDNKHYHWAIKKNRTYSLDRADWFRLCVKCHNKYDHTGLTKSEEHRRKTSMTMTGRPHTDERKTKIKEGKSSPEGIIGCLQGWEKRRQKYGPNGRSK